MKKVKLIIAQTMTDTVFFNYGDDYSDIARIFVEDHSPFEEVDEQEFFDLQSFVEDYNIFNKAKNSKSFAFIAEAMPEVSARSAIVTIREKQEKAAREWREKNEKDAAARAKKAADLKAAKELKTLEQKKAQLEKLKKELGE